VRLIWAIIPLVLFSIIGIQESFAQESKIIEIVYPIEQYIDSELIIKGNIIDAKNWNATFRIFDIKVEQYLKNSLDDDIVSIVMKTYSSKIGDSSFPEVKDDVLLHLKKTDRQDLRSRDLYAVSLYNSLFDNNKEIDIPPLQQLRISQKGYPLEKITCNSNLELIYKATDNSPACVKPKSVERLVSLGWALSNTESSKIWIGVIPVQCGNPWESYGVNILDHYPGTPEKHLPAPAYSPIELHRIDGLIIQQYYEDKGATIFERKFIPDATTPDLCEACSCNDGGYGWHFLVSTDSLELFEGWSKLN